MYPSKHHFLFVLLSSFIVRSQVLNPLTHCLANCLTCPPNSLATCTGQQSC